MSSKYNWSLNPDNLSAINAIDDFYNLYCDIQDIYVDYRIKFKESNPRRMLWPNDWDKSVRKAVRQKCEPVLNNYLAVFTSEFDHIFANAYGFERFSIFNVKVNDKPNQPGIIEVSTISFKTFLSEIQFAVTRILHRWKQHSLPSIEFDSVLNEINEHILRYVDRNTYVHVDASPLNHRTNSEILYIYQNLSSMSCFLNNHYLTPEIYLSELVEDGVISLPVHYCNQCNKFFIGELTLRLFEKKYGKLVACKKYLNTNTGFNNELNQESRLHQLGYNVSDGRTDTERQMLLQNLLEKGIITYSEIVRSIEWNIRYLNNKPAAVVKWKKDLKFIGQYILNNK